jgi:hypothetical protein
MRLKAVGTAALTLAAVLSLSGSAFAAAEERDGTAADATTVVRIDVGDDCPHRD